MNTTPRPMSIQLFEPRDKNEALLEGLVNPLPELIARLAIAMDAEDPDYTYSIRIRETQDSWEDTSYSCTFVDNRKRARRVNTGREVKIDVAIIEDESKRVIAHTAALTFIEGETKSVKLYRPAQVVLAVTDLLRYLKKHTHQPMPH